MTGTQPTDACCVFCDRVRNGEWEPTTDLAIVRFEPLNPVTPGHMLFLPKRHRENAATDPFMTGRAFEAASRWAQGRRISFNLVTSSGAEATQTIRHLHVHYVPRTMDDGLPLPWTNQPAVKGAA